MRLLVSCGYVMIVIMVTVTRMHNYREDREGGYAGQTYKHVNNLSHEAILAAEQCCYQVKFKEAYKTPVQGANDNQNEGDGS